MKPYALISFLLIFALAGCQSLPFKQKTAHADEKGLHVIFIYDQDAPGPVNDYFDALLDVINHSNLHRRQVTIHSGKAANLTSRYHLKDCPALIVKNNGVTQVRIEGQKNKQTILKELKQVIPLQQSRSSQ